ncbi:long-chain fatty acid--CoA ligase [Shewanella sp. 202IG2-18]|uniref:AMP-dependent synthetase/ligase n=1 Tax=Parashewanella hymeniacidonis TaxID=2807618 RepID=UPI001960F5FF|nr:long-chain fatty acid--CoA ligase [Parashewanella hymeniacidonis]MBM7071830.1 long-chain fatty acid--CoA ligase [Parashewanella hymeniacidonis]
MSLEQYHLISLLRKQSRTRSSEIALEGYDCVVNWKTVTWQRFEDVTNQIASWLIEHGIQTQDRCAIMSRNCPQWTCADVGILKARGVVVPLYPTSTVQQAAFIINDAEASVLFVEDALSYQMALELKALCPTLQRTVVFDTEAVLESEQDCHFDALCQSATDVNQNGELKARLQSSNLDDLLTLIYTSGTTGEPKGVMLDYRNVASTISQHDKKFNVRAGDTSLAFLPLSHIFERAWSFYALYRGMRNVYLTDTHKAKEAIADIKPHTLCVVPRFLEKVYSAIQDKVIKSSRNKKRIFNWAVAVGYQQFEANQGRQKGHPWLSLKWQIANKLVFEKLTTALGGNLVFMPCGGAALDANVERFFQAVNVPLLCGYGMTETTATITCNTVDSRMPGSNGQPLSETEVKIGENSEILVRGGSVMRGYYKRPEENGNVFDDEGWFKTGDAGEFDEEGNLFITDRIKELMKTSNGKYIAPQRVEGKVGCSPFIEQVAVIAEAKNYVTALIVPAFETLEEWAKEQGLKYSNTMELLRHNQVIHHFEERLVELQIELASFEQIKKFTLLPDEFSMEAGLITPTLKLRRKVIYNKYADEIRMMYER